MRPPKARNRQKSWPLVLSFFRVLLGLLHSRNGRCRSPPRRPLPRSGLGTPRLWTPIIAFANNPRKANHDESNWIKPHRPPEQPLCKLPQPRAKLTKAKSVEFPGPASPGPLGIRPNRQSRYPVASPPVSDTPSRSVLGRDGGRALEAFEPDHLASVIEAPIPLAVDQDVFDRNTAHTRGPIRRFAFKPLQHML